MASPETAPLMRADGTLAPLSCWVWRHPRPDQVAGRCIGHVDVPVDRRKAKRLAHRIRQHARRHGLPRVIHTSPLRRCALVGQVLRSWGWRHRRDPALLEMDFGAWDGRPWASIQQQEVDAWCDDFLHHAPGGGESLAHVFQRVADWCARWRAQGLGHDAALVVGHAGWMLTLEWLCTRSDLPTRAAQWPAPPSYGQCLQMALRPEPAPHATGGGEIGPQ